MPTEPAPDDIKAHSDVNTVSTLPPTTGPTLKDLTVIGVIIVGVRETSVWLMGLWDHAELGNLCGLFLLLGVLILLRRWRGLPVGWVNANALFMREGALAFLPISGGAILMLGLLGAELWPFLVVLVISTLMPLWIYARLAQHGLRLR